MVGVVWYCVLWQFVIGYVALYGRGCYDSILWGNIALCECGMVLDGIGMVVQYDMKLGTIEWNSVVWCCTVWCGVVVQFGVVLCCMMLFGVVWCGLLWYSLVWLDDMVVAPDLSSKPLLCSSYTMS